MPSPARSHEKAPYSLGILGAGGYGGQVLHRLALHHPCISPVVPEVREATDATPAQLEALAALDAVALALPEDAAHAWAARLREAGARRVIDLSGAHRQQDGVHYGIPELFGAPPAAAHLVANPGCYPTATLLALRPLVQAGVVEPEGIAVVGASGTSGAGKGLAAHLHFSELHDNFFPYGVGTHRHRPEIERHLGAGASVSFVTQLLPLVRGILVTAFVRPRGCSPAQLLDTLRDAYADAPFVSVVPAPDQALGLRHVVGTHQAVLSVGPVAHGGVVPVFASIDNLLRGAASQALHNVNLWLGLDAALGLPPPLPSPAGLPGMKATWT